MQVRLTDERAIQQQCLMTQTHFAQWTMWKRTGLAADVACANRAAGLVLGSDESMHAAHLLVLEQTVLHERLDIKECIQAS